MSGSEAEHQQKKRSVFFEVENVAVNARRMVYDVMESVLGDKGVKLDRITFARHCSDCDISGFVSKLLEAQKKTRLSEDKIIEDIEQGIKLSLTDTGLKMSNGLSELIKKVQDNGFALGGVAMFGHEVAGKLMENLGLNDIDLTVVEQGSVLRPSPMTNAWEELAEKCGTEPPLSVAVTTGVTGHRSCLAAGMRSVVVYDDFTSYQDFSGADLTTDKLNSEAVDVVIDLLKQVR